MQIGGEFVLLKQHTSRIFFNYISFLFVFFPFFEKSFCASFRWRLNTKKMQSHGLFALILQCNIKIIFSFFLFLIFPLIFLISFLKKKNINLLM
jgi:hypothetical protein